jgi:hypothetical protein
MMCLKCGQIFNRYLIIDGKRRNLGTRKYCTECSPFGANNRKDLANLHKKNKECLNCGKQLVKNNNRKKKYCNVECHKEHQNKEYINKWKSGEEFGKKGENVSQYIRRYILKIKGNKCEKCGWGEINPCTGQIPLQIHHLNGNWSDNSEGNLQLLCPNCHALTDNYGSRNKGNGRKTRKLWRMKKKVDNDKKKQQGEAHG